MTEKNALTGLRSASEPNGSREGPEFRPRIMVIDDEPTNLQVIRMVVLRERFPCELVLLENVPQALEYLRDHRVDLILLDVVMPGQNGFDMFEQLRANPDWAEIPVIFLSAIQEPEYIIRGLEMGASDYIGKPIISQVLTARIRAVLRINFLQNELKKRNVELESANRLKDEFLSICSHDLRSPLSAIELICQMLKEESGSLPEPEEQMIGRIINQTVLARRLVENILDLNKIKEGRLVPQPTFFSPQALLAGCVEDQRPIILAKNVKLETDLRVESAVCFGDREIIAQAVRNVLGNAVKFSRHRVALASRAVELEGERGGWWEIVVTDDGVGIAPEQMESIFHKYATTGLQDAGYGLGLYISHQTVKLHNGTITVQSVPNQSTAFTIRLPNTFALDALPDLGEISQASVRVYTPSPETGTLLENLLLEGGLVDVAVEALGAGSAEGILAQPPDIVLIDLQASPQDYYPLVRLMNNGSVTTRWVFLGTPQELDGLGMLTTHPFARLTSPVNPLLWLRLVKSLMADQLAGVLTRPA